MSVRIEIQLHGLNIIMKWSSAILYQSIARKKFNCRECIIVLKKLQIERFLSHEEYCSRALELNHRCAKALTHSQKAYEAFGKRRYRLLGRCDQVVARMSSYAQIVVSDRHVI